MIQYYLKLSINSDLSENLASALKMHPVPKREKDPIDARFSGIFRASYQD